MVFLTIGYWCLVVAIALLIELTNLISGIDRTTLKVFRVIALAAMMLPVALLVLLMFAIWLRSG